ncbi:MAG: VWA domain-containing protein [Alphaproteobacteria bacterium]|nr:VWA domain-containing protein [Alphaproteobacteria bacterium]
MSRSKEPAKTGDSAPVRSASDADVAAFLEQVKRAPAKRANTDARGRLIFGMDATASREPMWDQACQIQGEMFSATAALGGLDIQLIFYRGFGECKASKWAADAMALARLMTSVRCRAGRTQIGRILNHAKAEAEKHKIGALVFVGDCFEEDIDKVCHTAGEMGLVGVPAFMFHEGRDPLAARAFKEIARLSGGAYCPFDAGSARQLKELLSAVAVYAAGGRRAMLAYGEKTGGKVLQLTDQMARR